jgi:hypothetical protein
MLVDGVGGEFSIGKQVSLEYPNVFQTQFVRRTVEILSEFLNYSNVALACGFGIVPPNELFDHHLS